ncbi:D-alanine--poly(phosphoribitol) ligase [soil metagenome]
MVDGDRSITYAELDARAATLARLLVDLDVRRGDRVGLYLEKSIEALVGVYATLKAGAAYVPLDTGAPAARLGYIAGDCGIRHLLTSTQLAGSWDELVAAGAPVEHLVVIHGEITGRVPPPDVALLDATALGTRPAPASPSAPPEPNAAGRLGEADLAYILYTSGSTGTPKGVMLSHGNCLAFVRWAVEEFAVRCEDRLSSHAPLHFDLSTFDLFAAAAAGAAVVLVPATAAMFPVQVARFIRAERITVWYSVPSSLVMLVERGKLHADDLPSLRVLLFAGEVFPVKYLRRLMELLAHVRFANLYGPTETNVCTFYDIPALEADRTQPVPLGTAITGVEVFAAADDGALVPPGETGELWVEGPTVMQGYWGDPDRSAEALIDRGSGGRAYRTGDLARQLPDGTWEFLGRRDDQVKSRGYRVELGEIEAALHTHPGVVECAVVAVPDEQVTNRIKAYAVVVGAVTVAELARACAARLPRYMVPEELELCEALPKTSTGKTDRRALLDSTKRSETP